MKKALSLIAILSVFGLSNLASAQSDLQIGDPLSSKSSTHRRARRKAAPKAAPQAQPEESPKEAAPAPAKDAAPETK